MAFRGTVRLLKYDPEATMIIRFLSMKAVVAKTSLSRSQIYRLIKDGDFPQAVPLGGRVAYIESEVTAWIEARIREAREAA